MPRTNKVITNVIGGELSPLMYGRIDLPIYQKGLARCENFITLPQGGARFRTGTEFVKQTRLNQTGAFIPFQFNDEQSYLIEVTDRKFRFYKDESAILEAPSSITAITNANPGEITTSAVHGLAIDDEVFVDGAVGLTRLNGRFFRVNTVPSTTKITLKSIEGVVINTTTYGTYTSGGTVSRVYEITTPYRGAHVADLQFAQNADTMYITHQRYAPRKLTRAGHTSWTLATYTRTADPFLPPPVTDKDISSGSNANPGVLGFGSGHGLAVGDEIEITGTVAGTQWDTLHTIWLVNTVVDSTHITVKDPFTGVPVDTTTWGAMGANKHEWMTNSMPRTVCFIDSARLMFGSSKIKPETVWASKAPSTGTTAFDNFTTGTAATDALIFTLAPIHGKVDNIQWMTSTSKFIVLGTFGAIRRLYGSTETEPISPTAVTAKSVVGYGCAYTLPVSTGNSLFFIQRGGKNLRSLEYDFTADSYVVTDRNLVAEHLTTPGIIKIVEQQSQPDVLWTIRNDGRFLGLTYKEREDISGWHQHYLGGQHVDSAGLTVSRAKIISVGRMPRPVGGDQLWFITERKIGANTIRAVEFLTDVIDYPLPETFYTNPTAKASDKTKYINAQYEAQRKAKYLDMSAMFDGSALGLAAGASVTPSAVTGAGITLTASAAVFTSAMVGREVWKGYDSTGTGGGRATITGFTNSTTVTATVTVDFNNTNAMPAGTWYLTSASITGLDYLEGQTVTVNVDGAPATPKTVANGAITLDGQASTCLVGYGYVGRVHLLTVDSGGVLGPAAYKVKNLAKANFRFLNSGGVGFGTDIYRTEKILFRSTGDLLDRPTPLFSGIKEQNYGDNWEKEKQLVIVQEQALPCTITAVDQYLDTSDE